MSRCSSMPRSSAADRHRPPATAPATDRSLSARRCAGLALASSVTGEHGLDVRLTRALDWVAASSWPVAHQAGRGLLPAHRVRTPSRARGQRRTSRARGRAVRGRARPVAAWSSVGRLSRRERGDSPIQRERRRSPGRLHGRSSRSCGGTASRRQALRRRHRLALVRRPDRCRPPWIAGVAPGRRDDCQEWLGCRSRRTRFRRWRRRRREDVLELLPAHQRDLAQDLAALGFAEHAREGRVLAQVSARRAVLADDPPGSRRSAHAAPPPSEPRSADRSSHGRATSRSGAGRRRPSTGAAAARRLGGRQGCGDRRARVDRWSSRAAGASLDRVRICSGFRRAHRRLEHMALAPPGVALLVDRVRQVQEHGDGYLLPPVGAVDRGQVTLLDPALQRGMTDPQQARCESLGDRGAELCFEVGADGYDVA